MAALPSGTVAFLFTDIEGSTAQWETQRDAMKAAVLKHLALLRGTVEKHQGDYIKHEGAAIRAAFRTVPQALAAAIDGQLALAAEDWGSLGPIRVRVAIHVGDAAPLDGDYLDPALNRLARVLAAGHGEQILLTEAAEALASSRLPSG